MPGLFNFIDRTLCEYATVFPTVASLMDHLFFTEGNGYTFDTSCGMFIDSNGQRLDRYKCLSDAELEYLVCSSKNKEAEYWSNSKVDVNYIYDRYKIHKTSSKDITVRSLLTDISSLDISDDHVRPYPLSRDGSCIFLLNNITPKYLVRIAYNLCRAWNIFLTYDTDGITDISYDMLQSETHRLMSLLRAST